MSKTEQSQFHIGGRLLQPDEYTFDRNDGTLMVHAHAAGLVPKQNAQLIPIAWVSEQAVSWLAERQWQVGAVITTQLMAKGPTPACQMPIYSQHALDAAVAAERERWQALERKPLTLEQGRAILAEQFLRPASPAGDLDLIRAVERAHGIGA